MNVRKMSLDELELLSYQDIAYEILKEDKCAKATPDLFKEVCFLLQIDEDTMFDMIGDFYTTLTTDKRFILLDEAKWDLKEFHIVKTIIDDEEDDEQPEEEEITSEETEDEAVLPNTDEYDENDDLDDLDDLSIVTEEELEEE